MTIRKDSAGQISTQTIVIALVVAMIVVVAFLGLYWLLVATAAPSAVGDLRVVSISTSSVALVWTAPNPGFGHAKADRYEIRYSTLNLSVPLNWSTAPIVSNPPSPGFVGASESIDVGGLSAGNRYYFALISLNNDRSSGLSNVAVATTVTYGASYEAVLTDDQRQANIGAPIPVGPFSVDTNSTEVTKCTLRIGYEVVHNGECARFRYEYRYREVYQQSATVELELSLGANNTTARVIVIFRASITMSISRTENVNYVGEEGRLGFSSETTVSSEVSESVKLLNWTFSLDPGQNDTRNTTGHGWVWVNITLSLTATYILEINHVTVVEGDCLGFVVMHYHGMDESTDFEVSLKVEAQSENVTGQAVITGAV